MKPSQVVRNTQRDFKDYISPKNQLDLCISLILQLIYTFDYSPDRNLETLKQPWLPHQHSTHPQQICPENLMLHNGFLLL